MKKNKITDMTILKFEQFFIKYLNDPAMLGEKELMELINSTDGYKIEATYEGDQEEPEKVTYKLTAPRLLNGTPEENRRDDKIRSWIDASMGELSKEFGSVITLENINAKCPMEEWTDEEIFIYYHIPYIHYGS